MFESLVGLLPAYGLLGLFLICFFSASLLPFPSEPAIVLALKFFDPYSIFLIVLISSTLAASINYFIGLKGLRVFFVKRDPADEKKAEKWFEKWGAPALLASTWLPFIGDLFPLVAGTLGMKWQKFLFLIVVARVIKTIAVIFFGFELLTLF